MATYYVKWDATGSGNGTSWENAYTAILAAISARSSAGNTFVVSGGSSGHIYSERLYTVSANTTIINSTEPGHNGQVIVDSSALAFDTIMVQHAGLNVAGISFRSQLAGNAVSAVSVNSAGSAVFNNCLFDRCGRVFYSSDQLGVVFKRCIFKGIDGNTGSYSMLQTGGVGSGVVTFEHCIFFELRKPIAARKGTLNFHNSLFVSPMNVPNITLEEYGGPCIVNISNSILIGAGGTSLSALVINNPTTSGVVNLASSLILPNPLSADFKPVPANVVDGGGNIGLTESAIPAPRFIANRRPAIVTIGIDDYVNRATWEVLSGKLIARGWRGVWCIESAQVANDPAFIADQIRAGHEVAVHSANHTDLSTNGLKAFNIRYVGAAESCTLTIAGNTLTTSQGLSIDLTQGVNANVGILADGINALADYTCDRVGLGPYANAGNSTALEDVTNVDIKTSSYTALRSAPKYYAQEIAGAKQQIESAMAEEGLDFTAKTFVFPGNLCDNASAGSVKDAGFIGSRGNNLQSFLLSSSNVFLMYCQMPKDIFKSATNKRNACGLLSYMSHAGGYISLYGHNFTEWSEAQWDATLDCIEASGAMVMTASEAAEYIQSAGVTTDGFTYAIAFEDTIPSYQLKPSSPCVGAGVDVGLTTDADGNAVPGALGYDIGPYSYMPGWSLFDESMPSLTLSPDCPGKLKSVQEWSKVASAREIGKY